MKLKTKHVVSALLAVPFMGAGFLVGFVYWSTVAGFLGCRKFIANL